MLLEEEQTPETWKKSQGLLLLLVVVSATVANGKSVCPTMPSIWENGGHEYRKQLQSTIIVVIVKPKDSRTDCHKHEIVEANYLAIASPPLTCKVEQTYSKLVEAAMTRTERNGGIQAWY